MTKVEICRMCLEYSTDMTCEHIRECKLMKVLDENKKLKEDAIIIIPEVFR